MKIDVEISFMVFIEHFWKIERTSDKLLVVVILSCDWWSFLSKITIHSDKIGIDVTILLMETVFK